MHWSFSRGNLKFTATDHEELWKICEARNLVSTAFTQIQEFVCLKNAKLYTTNYKRLMGRGSLWLQKKGAGGLLLVLAESWSFDGIEGCLSFEHWGT